MLIPEFLKDLGKSSEANRKWVESLPSIINKLKEDWGIEIGNPITENASCSLVAPCLWNKKEPAILKIGFPHEEAFHEIEGLKVLRGKPAVHLLNFDKSTNSLLLEKCTPGTSLSTESEPVQDEIICKLLSKIWAANYSSEPFRPLKTMVALWNRETHDDLRKFPDQELAKKGCQIKERLCNTTDSHVLLATDLHAGNVLKAERKPWLVIDIKPYVGDRTYDLTQHLLNCMDRLYSDPIGTINRVAQLAGVDPTRLKDWMYARLASENGGVHQGLASKLIGL